ncbi:hydrolase [Desulfuromonas versatilis]|uniref:Hydrolase n=1 Tax=Desulfuromonas versatilis TaxID=2802975 RepID=A0ABM8HYI2_9BACT|nr:hydrolase [Desulfuromonas versatilis]
MTNQGWEVGLTRSLKAAFGRGIGVHLNLSEGRPILGGSATLTDARGCFLPKQQAWRRALCGGYRPDEVEAEWAAQIEAAQARGIEPSHLDGHNHIHVFPQLAEVAARLARRYGILRIRLPLESVWGRSPRRGVKGAFFGQLAGQAARVFSAAGLVFPQHFAGIHFPRPGRVDELLALLDRLPEGTSELMCHPGYARLPEGSGFSSPRRMQELSALCDPNVLEAIRNRNIRLVNFTDIPLP